MSSIKSTFVKLITIIDPDNNQPIELEIRKLASGAIVGFDAPYLEAEIGPIFSPYHPGMEVEIPDDECGEWVV